MATQKNSDGSILSEKIPLVLTGRALQSLRDSGYTLSAALGEVIDNSIEANANNITLHFEESKAKSGKKHIHRITIIDDGDGMPLDVLQRYPQLGYSTRYMQTDTIGKYGVGAKLAALNYGQRIDVWSRINKDIPWHHVWFDLEEVLVQEQEDKIVGIEFPSVDTLPDNILTFAPDTSGTIVSWSKVDRLEEGKKAPDAQALKAEVQHELARMFRYFLRDGICIMVEGTKLLPHDPLYLMEETWANQELVKYYSRLRKGDSKGDKEKPLPLPTIEEKYFTAIKIATETIKVDNHTCTLKVTLYPKEIIRRRGMGGDVLAEKLRIPENEGAISFVRLNREINYTNVPRIFPRGVQSPDRFIGIEVAFSPELDSYFGVRNVKRGVEPYDELRTQIRGLLNKYILEARNLLEEIWGQVSQSANDSNREHQSILDAAKDANRTLPKSRVKTLLSKEEKEKILDDLAKDVVGKELEKQEKYREEIKDLPFVVESVDIPGNLLIDTQHIDGKVIIRINTRHRFYREMWEPLHSIATTLPVNISGDEAAKAARRSIEALTLLIIAYGKAESMDDNPREHFTDLRSDWGRFTDSLMSKVKDVI